MYNAKYLQPQVNTKGLLAHYKMWDGLMATGKIFDYTSTGKGGTLVDTDTPKTLVPTYPGFNLTPTNDYIKIDDHADFTPAGTPFSISAWVYMHVATDFVIASKGVIAVDWEWRFLVEGDDRITFQVADESVDSCWRGRRYSEVLTGYVNQWLHWVATYDGGILPTSSRIHLNGERVDDTSTEGADFVAVENLDHDVWIGRSDTQYADGLIDDMMFFNRVLDTTEVKSIYSVTRQRYGV